MPKRPNRYPDFGWLAGASDLVEPTTAVRESGFDPGTKPLAQNINFLFNLFGAWFRYLRGPSLSNWTRYSAPDLDTQPLPRSTTRIAADTVTPEREIAPARYVVAGNVSGAIKVWVSSRGVGWADRSAQLPGGLVADDVAGLYFAPADKTWWLWTETAIVYTPADDGVAASAIRASAPGTWQTTTIPAGAAYEPRALAEAPGVASTWAAITASAFMGSSDRANWTAIAHSGARTGDGLDMVRTATQFVSITATGEVWRAATIAGPFAKVATLAVTNSWRLAYGNGRLVAYQREQATTVIQVSTDEGATWVAATVPVAVRKLSRLAYVDDAWVATATDAPYVWTSNDLVTWERAALPIPETGGLALLDFVYAEGAITAVGDGFAYQSARAHDAGSGPADAVSTPSPLMNAGLLQGVPVDNAAPVDGAVLRYDDGDEAWEPSLSAGASGQVFQYLGGERVGRRSVAANHVCDSGIVKDYLVVVTSTAAPRTITLPAFEADRVIVVFDGSGGAATNNITVAPPSGTINGAANKVINTNYGSATFWSDGAAWFFIG